MKTYEVQVDITMATTIYVDMEDGCTEQDIKQAVMLKVANNPYYYAGCADAWVKTEVVDYQIED